MKTSIIILTYNQMEYTQKCIESIREYTELDQYEIIIVDNNSTDGTLDWLRNQSDVQVIANEQNCGFPKGYNQGIAIASGDNILLLKSDVIVTYGWLSNLNSCLYSNEKVGAVGPVTNNCTYHQAIWSAYTNMEEMQIYAKKINQSKSRDWEERLKLAGFCMLIKKEVIDRVGLLDEVFTPGGLEDDDYSFRIRLAGYKLLMCKDTFIHNFGSQTLINHNILKINHDNFVAKWGFDSRYSTSVRYDLISFIDKPQDYPLKVLEIGCACGGTLMQIKNVYNEAEVYGVEFNAKAAVSAKLIADVVAGDIEKTSLSYPQEFFDYIILGDVLEHLENPWNVLKNISAYLKPDGYILAGLPNVMHFSVIRNLIQGNWTYEDAGLLDKTHLRFFTLSEIKKMFETTGYQLSEYQPIHVYETMTDKSFIQTVAALAGNLNMAEQYRAYQYRVKAAKAL